MTQSLLSIFPDPDDLLGLDAEELGGVLLEVIPEVSQNEMFTIDSLDSPLFPQIGGGYPYGIRQRVRTAIAEALSWLTSQGLVIRDPDQAAAWHRLTKRARSLRTRADVEAYRRGRMLPVELLPTILLEKVWPLFHRGDHDVAVFQAFKEVEVAVRRAANAKGAGYADDVVGVTLMRKAFHNETGPLADKSKVAAEREAETSLFAGGIGCAKNPTGHRDVNMPPQEAARLIVFAGHLLDVVERRLV
jgi:hypothetical protein